MSFKLYSDAQTDQPMVVCDVCEERIGDLWNSKATGTPTHDGQISDVIVHHAACPAVGAVTISLRDFFKLFAIANQLGDTGSDGVTNKACVEYPVGKGFEV